MGVFDLLRPSKTNRADAKQTKSALEAANDPRLSGGADGAVNKLLSTILSTGLDGIGPLDSAQKNADQALAETGDAEKAVNKVGRRALVGGGVGGFFTGLGGFVTMPVALPVNVLEFYVQAAQMVGSIATLRGYDIKEPQIRTAILLTLVGADADDVLAKAGLATGGGRLTAMALKNLPPAALMVINKAVGFRLLRGVGSKVFSRFGRGVPVIGGVVGGGVDAVMMKRIADQARKEFPAKASVSKP